MREIEAKLLRVLKSGGITQKDLISAAEHGADQEITDISGIIKMFDKYDDLFIKFTDNKASDYGYKNSVDMMQDSPMSKQGRIQDINDIKTFYFWFTVESLGADLIDKGYRENPKKKDIAIEFNTMLNEKNIDDILKHGLPNRNIRLSSQTNIRIVENTNISEAKTKLKQFKNAIWGIKEYKY